MCLSSPYVPSVHHATACTPRPVGLFIELLDFLLFEFHFPFGSTEGLFEMQSKFWAAGADSLESEYSSESDDQEQVVRLPT